MNYLQEHYTEIFKKYTKEEIIKDIEKYKYEDGSLQKTLNQFFEETIFKCCGKKAGSGKAPPGNPHRTDRGHRIPSAA